LKKKGHPRTEGSIQLLAAAFNDLGYTLLDSGLAEEALTNWTQALQTYKLAENRFASQIHGVTANIGVAHRHCNRLIEAEHIFQTLLDSDPAQAELNLIDKNNLAEIQHRMKNIKRQKLYFEQLLNK
jgi:tetratricopeptide (TPR) repeat protein